MPFAQSGLSTSTQPGRPGLLAHPRRVRSQHDPDRRIAAAVAQRPHGVLDQRAAPMGQQRLRAAAQPPPAAGGEQHPERWGRAGRPLPNSSVRLLSVPERPHRVTKERFR